MHADSKIHIHQQHAVLRTALIHTRQQIPRQKRFRMKGGRGDEALKIGDLLIASKVPKASDLA